MTTICMLSKNEQLFVVDNFSNICNIFGNIKHLRVHLSMKKKEKKKHAMRINGLVESKHWMSKRAIENLWSTLWVPDSASGGLSAEISPRQGAKLVIFSNVLSTLNSNMYT